MDLFETFRIFGLTSNTEVKIYRHSDNAVDYDQLIEAGHIEPYQAIHGHRTLGSGLVAFFVAEPKRIARFIGIWAIADSGPVKGLLPENLPADFPSERHWHDHCYFYPLEKQAAFSSIEGRLIIRWPEGRSNHRWLIDRKGKIEPHEVIQIRPAGFLGNFPGFNRLIIPFPRLRRLAEGGDGGAGWIEALRSTRGVYLISDIISGELYVGSATGADGLWGRWANYGASVHGNNKVMIDRVQNIEGYADRLQVSVLETLSSLANKDDGIAAEGLWKRKLGERARTLNGN